LFKRYPPTSRRAIYYAREAALSDGAQDITPDHLLFGIAFERTSRANVLFGIRDWFVESYFSEHAALSHHEVSKRIPLSAEGKKVLLYAKEEANGLKHWWIDTDHLILGILRLQECHAASVLHERGIQLQHAREVILQAEATRENFGPTPVLWWIPIDDSRVRIGVLYAIFLLALFVALVRILR
jgi:ATP-dependent Clp protease ATP-binding subunit ClpC